MSIPVSTSGQALTEFLISASFVLIPLFLIVPVMGKYIDLKQATVQAARYGAWEYTAHTVSSRDYSSGFDALPSQRLPTRTLEQVQGETLRRFYSNPRLPLDSTQDALLGHRAADANPFWTYHDGSPMLNGPTANVRGPQATPDRARISTGVLRSIQRVAGIWNRLLSALGVDAGFDAIDTKGNFHMAAEAPVAEAPGYTVFNQASARPLFLSPLDLRMRARASVLTDGWSAGGRDHAAHQSRGLVPSVLLRKPMRPIQRLAGFLLTPEIAEDKLIWGHMVVDQVPEEHLGGKPPACPGGYCRHE